MHMLNKALWVVEHLSAGRRMVCWLRKREKQGNKGMCSLGHPGLKIISSLCSTHYFMYKFIIIIFCSITHLLKRNYNLCNSYYVAVKNFKQIRNKDIKQIYGTFKNNSY